MARKTEYQITPAKPEYCNAHSEANYHDAILQQICIGNPFILQTINRMLNDPGNEKLQAIDCHKRQKTEEQPRSILFKKWQDQTEEK